ncbi:Mu transposase C-terminal domain-containing protein [Roseinatronobacter monicus]|uniref:Putative transposase n=1 Tax=Roseinatronobacter monicus TaxID=393481 RepID=A0A543KE03_9RHOB|nr:Mu transposase C-terminal domain-containing protein [Roseinatronobacter monicus]TQM93264.1 putative transposase [Roseinatronobacter monicus]
MALDLINSYPTFSLDPHHLYIIDSQEYRFAYRNTEAVSFSLKDDPTRIVSYRVGDLNRMNGAGLLEVIPMGLISAGVHLDASVEDGRKVMASLSEQRRQAVDMRHAFVRAVLDLHESGELTLTEASIKHHQAAILENAKAYLVQDLPKPEHALALEKWKKGEGKKPKTGAVERIPSEKSARSILGWVRKYRAGGKVALIDSRHNQGNRYSYFLREENDLMAKVVQKEYMTLNRKTIKVVHQDLKNAFLIENERRFDAGQSKLRCPGYETLRVFIASIDKFHKLVARFGQKTALKKMGSVKAGLEISRPLERVEMDEWKIDLLTLLRRSGLLDFFGQDELQEMGLLDERGELRQMKRWWLVASICCRTRCILGMVLTADPTSSGAIKCLQMTMSDKGQFADAVGALSPWSMFGKPETLAVDNGAAFKSIAFTSACMDSGVSKIATIAGNPAMRGCIERVFSTFRMTLIPRLPGRTFSNNVERGDHPSEQRACLSIDDLAFILVRWIIDVYHNSPHEGLGGRTPLEQWEADMQDGNYQLHSAPNLRQRRLAFGLATTRRVQKDGIRTLNVQYNSGELHAWFLKNGNCDVEVRWLADNIGAIEVLLDGIWVEVAAVSNLFKDMDASTWNATRRALRTKDPKRVDWEEHVIIKAIRAVEEIKKNQMSTLSIIDHVWTPKRLAQADQEASVSINIVPTLETTSASSEGMGVSVIPVEPPKPVTKTTIAMKAAPTARPANDKWSIPVIGNDKPETKS